MESAYALSTIRIAAEFPLPLTAAQLCITIVLQGGYMLTIRLDDDTEREIKVAVKTLGVSKSELIRRSIKEYLTKIHKPSFGDAASSLELEDIDESEDLSEKVESRLRERFSL